MESVIDIMSALPGERFRFRMIGSLKSWYRYFLSDGSHVDCDTEINGLPCTKVFASFAIDREDQSVCIVLMPGDLAKMLAKRFKLFGSHPGSEEGVDVGIDISDGSIRYIVDVGRCSVLDNPDIIQGVESMWQNVVDEVRVNADESLILSMDVVKRVIPDWGELPCVYDSDEFSECIDEGKYRDLLVSFLVESSVDESSSMSKSAARILRRMRISEVKKGKSEKKEEF